MADAGAGAGADAGAEPRRDGEAAAGVKVEADGGEAAVKPEPEADADDADADADAGEEAASEADSDDDGIELVLRGPEELGQLTENPYAEEEGLGEETNGGETKEAKENADKEGGEGGGANDDDEEEEEEEEEKFKFSHGKKRKRYPKLPGRAGTINADNYTQYHAELGKRNTPFEVDLSQMVDKPWARLNASLDDFFNFGFNEQSWKEYAARQVALRIHDIDQAKENSG